METFRNIGNLYNKRSDVISLGFPCQDISICGNGTGLAGKRSSLWFWAYEIIRRNKPAFCIIENVPALRIRGADTVLVDLEKAGYAARPFVVEACAVGADQARERVWIIAYLNRNRASRCKSSPDIGEAGSGRQGGEAYLQPTNWRTRPLFGGVSPPILCRRTDGVSLELDSIINENGNNQKKVTEASIINWEVLRFVWFNQGIAKASPDLYRRRFCDLVPGMSHERAQIGWLMGERLSENKELCDLWQTFCSIPFQKAQELQPILLKRARAFEREKKMARANRIACLGNSIVPQVAQIFARFIYKQLRPQA